MTAPETELRRVWRRTVGRRHEPAFDALMARHREPHRRYHTATHVMWVCRHVDQLLVATQVSDPAAVTAAALYHDAVYAPTAAPGDNERASADLAGRVLGECNWSADRVQMVRALIRATATHEVPADLDAVSAAVLLDADLAILGADPPSYRAYVTGVRAEYAHVSDDGWRSGRRTVLDHFLERDRVFLTDTMHAQLDRRARANLSAERSTLVTR